MEIAIGLLIITLWIMTPGVVYHAIIGRKAEWQDSTIAFSAATFVPWVLFGLWLVQM